MEDIKRLLEEKLKDTDQSKILLNKIIDNYNYLVSLESKIYKDLEEKDKVRINEIIYDMLFCIKSIRSISKKDYYVLLNNYIGNFLHLFYNFDDMLRINKHNNIIENYLISTDEVSKIVCDIDNRNIDDFKVAFELIWLCYFTLSNDYVSLKDKLLNANNNNYTDMDYQINDRKHTLLITLRSKNRNYNIEKNEE